MIILISGNDIKSHTAVKLFHCLLPQTEPSYYPCSLFVAVRAGHIIVEVCKCAQRLHVNFSSVIIPVKTFCHEMIITGFLIELAVIHNDTCFPCHEIVCVFNSGINRSVFLVALVFIIFYTVKFYQPVFITRSGINLAGTNIVGFSVPGNDCLCPGTTGRGTHTYPDTPRDMVNVFDEFDKPEVRNKIKSYMVQHYNTSPTVKTTQANSGPAECLAAGIPYWTNYIDTAVEMKGWAAFCIHTIRPDTHDTRSGHYIYQSQADELFGHAQKLSDSGKLWIATVSEGMIYANEWSSASVEAYTEGDKVVVTLDHKEKGSYYTMPLTIKVALPTGKTSASADGKALKVFSENGKTYAYVDVAPKSSVTVDVK